MSFYLVYTIAHGFFFLLHLAAAGKAGLVHRIVFLLGGRNIVGVAGVVRRRHHLLATRIWLDQSRTQQHHRTDAHWPSDQHAGGGLLRRPVAARLDGGRGVGFLGRRTGAGGDDTIIGERLDHLRALVRPVFWSVEPQCVCGGGDKSHLQRKAGVGGRYRECWFHVWSIYLDPIVCLCSQLARGVFSVVRGGGTRVDLSFGVFVTDVTVAARISHRCRKRGKRWKVAGTGRGRTKRSGHRGYCIDPRHLFHPIEEIDLQLPLFGVDGGLFHLWGDYYRLH